MVDLGSPHPASFVADKKRGVAERMYRYIICVAICAVIWILNGRCIFQSARERISGEVYTHTGLGVFFTLLTLELVLGEAGAWMRGNISWLQIVGYILYVPSAFLVFGSMIELKHKGKAKTLAPHGTARLVQTGIYGIVRHPMWLGMAIWSTALILIFQSILSVILGAVAIVCFRMGTTREDEFNIKEFGDAYREYGKRVPMWNAFKGLRQLRKA
jgi:protein-S-isoprenylcysteine O-methyltransferase Ste14